MSETKKLYRQIADSISADIESGRYQPGDRLPTERDLAQAYGVSRPSMREALIALEIRGLIEAKHGVGILVLEPPVRVVQSDAEIGAFELIEARRMFEGEVAAMAATQRSDENIAELEQLLEAMGDPDQEKAEKADRDFHFVIAQSTGNGALVATVETLWDWRYRSPFARNILERAADLGMTDRIAEHRDILEALKAGSAPKARRAMHAHMDRVIEHLLRATELEAVETAKSQSNAQRAAFASRFRALHHP